MLVDIGLGDSFIFAEKIKFVIPYNKPDYTTASVKKIIKRAKEDNKYFSFKNKKDGSSISCYIVLEDNFVFCSTVSSKTIADRCFEAGKRLYEVTPEMYISVSHIKAILSVGAPLAAGVEDYSKIAGNDLQFVRQREKKYAILLMTTGESVKLSKHTKDIVEELKVYAGSPKSI